MPPRQSRWRARAASAAIAFAALLGSVALASPAAAQEQPSNLVRHGPNLTLVLADCTSPADTAIAVALSRHVRHGAAACLDADGVPAELADLIADFAPDRVLVIGGEEAVAPAVMDELSALARSAFRWAVIQRLGGETRVETAAVAARVALDTPDRVGLDTITLIVADGWNDAHINTAREFAATVDDAAIVYFSPVEIADGFPKATASLIADYRSARVVFAGPADEVGLAAEAAAAAVLSDIGLRITIERVALAGATPSVGSDAAMLTGTARETFKAISAGDSVPTSADAGEELPLLALTQASGIRGVGSTLWTVRSDGTDRSFRTDDHDGWEWHPSDGRLAWATPDKQVFAAEPDGEPRLLAEEGVWPLWSPDGSRVIVFVLDDVDGDGWTDRAEAFMSNADGAQRRSLGFVDLRTWYYADLQGGMWSPDGTHIAYVTGDVDPETLEVVGNVRIESADDSTPAVTLADDGIILRWAPDGRHLLYATPHDCDGDDSDDSWNLWVAAADGSNPRQISTIDFRAWSVVIINPWSPDGSHIAYKSVDPQDCSTELHVSTVDDDSDGDGEPVNIAADVKFLGWSPDSTYLEYGAETDRLVTDYLLPEQSWVAHRDGGSKRYIGELAPSAFGWILWSDDGTRIAYTELLRDADGNEAGLRARTERTDGSVESTTLAELGNSLSWSGDGRLAYVAGHDDDGDGVPDRETLLLHHPDSADDDVQLVHALPAPTRNAIWSPDGSQLIYASGSVDSLIGWFRDRGRGVDAWDVATSEPRWTYRLITDVTWGEWQPETSPE